MTTPIDPAAADFGKYRLLRKLAQGGMAEIFLAIQGGIQGFEKVVVVKRVLPDLTQSDDFVNMFLDEARIAARLDHTNIVRIYDLGEVNGLFYIAMEYIPGEDLTSVLQQCKRLKRLIPIEIAVDCIISAAEGLAFAHELEDNEGRPMNLVHRDISPSNILVSYQGIVKVVDFGIARAETNVSKTEGGQLKGKIQYLSPEQSRGLKVDRRSDVFALGITLHELLTSHRLFQRESQVASIHAILSEELEPPSLLRAEIPEELDNIVMKALERKLEDRYQTASELAADLSLFLMHRGYVRSGQKIVDFLTEVFGEERKKVKLRVAKGLKLDDSGGARTMSGTNFPAVVAHKPGTGSQSGKISNTGLSGGHFTPVRSDTSSRVKPPTNPSNPHLPKVATPAGPPSIAPAQQPLIEGELAEPVAPKKKSPLPIVAGLASALVVVLGGLLYVTTRPPEQRAEVLVPPPPPKTDETPRKVDPLPPPKIDETPPAKRPGLEVGGLRFTGVPAGAKVTVDGNAVGNPGGESFFAAGKHEVQVDARGMLPFSTSVEITAGAVQTVQVALKPEPKQARGTLDITCQPWCSISVDGRDTGKTSPARISVTAGTHTLLLANGPAGLAKKLTVTVQEGAVVKRVVKLDE